MKAQGPAILELWLGAQLLCVLCFCGSGPLGGGWLSLCPHYCPGDAVRWMVAA